MLRTYVTKIMYTFTEDIKYKYIESWYTVIQLLLYFYCQYDLGILNSCISKYYIYI